MLQCLRKKVVPLTLSYHIFSYIVLSYFEGQSVYRYFNIDLALRPLKKWLTKELTERCQADQAVSVSEQLSTVRDFDEC